MGFTNGTVNISRAEALQLVIKRDGDYCRIPGCKTPTVFSNSNPRTLEHVFPRAKGGADDLSNLELAHQKCNNWKGDREYIGVDEETGLRILEPMPFKEPKSQVVKRPPTECCNEGHDLGPEEVCDVCGSLPQPYKFPKWAQMDSKDCDHSVFHCKWCVIGLYPRTPASIEALVDYDGAELHDPEDKD